MIARHRQESRVSTDIFSEDWPWPFEFPANCFIWTGSSLRFSLRQSYSGMEAGYGTIIDREGIP